LHLPVIVLEDAFYQMGVDRGSQAEVLEQQA